MNTLIVGILASKGGVGKTTLATNLARAVQLDGFKSIIIDTDPQGTARDWSAAADAEADQPPVIGVDSARVLERDLEDITASYDVAFVDGSAKLSGDLGVLVRISDAILIPVQPTPYDIWGAEDTVRSLPPGKKASFVVSRQIAGTNLADEVQEALENYELPVLEGRTTQRVAYAEAAFNGRSVLEGSDSKAKTEVETIKDNLYDLLND